MSDVWQKNYFYVFSRLSINDCEVQQVNCYILIDIKRVLTVYDEDIILKGEIPLKSTMFTIKQGIAALVKDWRMRIWAIAIETGHLWNS